MITQPMIVDIQATNNNPKMIKKTENKTMMDNFNQERVIVILVDPSIVDVSVVVVWFALNICLGGINLKKNTCNK